MWSFQRTSVLASPRAVLQPPATALYYPTLFLLQVHGDNTGERSGELFHCGLRRQRLGRLSPGRRLVVVAARLLRLPILVRIPPAISRLLPFFFSEKHTMTVGD